MAQWESGNFLGKEDSVCLLEAAKQQLTLVTYDRRTIPPLLKLWGEEERSHGGVIFVDEKTISPADIGGLVRALIFLTSEVRKIDWTNQVYFLADRKIKRHRDYVTQSVADFSGCVLGRVNPQLRSL
jgi:hypothetical protein